MSNCNVNRKHIASETLFKNNLQLNSEIIQCKKLSNNLKQQFVL